MGTFGKRLKIERERKGFNQKEFAEAIGITPTRLNYWEKDKREPNFSNIRKIIDVLECDADYLLGTKFSASKPDEKLQELTDNWDAMNDAGHDELLKQSRLLLKDPQYLACGQSDLGETA